MKKVGKKTFFVIAGEQSGDLHGSKLIKSIKKLYPNSHFIGHGGELMKKEGLKLIYHTNDLAVMGLTEVVKKLPFLLNVMGETLGKIKSFTKTVEPHGNIFLILDPVTDDEDTE